jgi:Sir2- and TIR-associating SLOG family/SIR2-like domain
MEGYPVDAFVREYSSKIDEGRGAVFCGAGTSISVGMDDWKRLLAGIAQRLGLHIDFISDLVELAQFSENERRTRDEIHELIVNEFGRLAKASALHQNLVRLPIRTIWTTNYDKIIEQSYRDAGFRPDVKISAASLAAHPRLVDVTIYKMHGDVEDPDHTILTKRDYDEYSYSERGRAFLPALEAAFLSQTFLFLGFSFSDPNVDRVLGRLSLFHGMKQRSHYCIMKRPALPAEEAVDKERQRSEYRLTELRINDLRERFKINTILVDKYDEIPALLERLGAVTRRNYVFVSGAAYDYAPLGEARLRQLAGALGRMLAREGKFLISGFGAGIGQDVAAGFFQEGYKHEARELTDRAILRPFPQHFSGAISRDEFWDRYREDMLRHAGFVVYIAGTRADADGKPELAAGMRREFEIANALGAVPVPMGVTGGMALELHRQVSGRMDHYYPEGANVRNELAILGDASKTNDAWLSAIRSLMDKVVATMSVP